jgi:hypothetical protein
MEGLPAHAGIREEVGDFAWSDASAACRHGRPLTPTVNVGPLNREQRKEDKDNRRFHY